MNFYDTEYTDDTIYCDDSIDEGNLIGKTNSTHPDTPTKMTFSNIQQLHLSKTNLESMIKRKLKLFTATALWNLDDKKISHFNSKFSESFTSWKEDKLKYTADINITRNKKGVIICVKVSVNQLNVQETQKVATVYEGIFLPCLNASKISSDMSDICVRLPFLLCSGSIKCVFISNNLLDTFFGCNIKEYKFSQDDLKWISSLLVHHVEDNGNASFATFYEGNVMRKGKDSKYVVKNVTDFATVEDSWNSVHTSRRSISFEEVLSFHGLLGKHYQNTNGITTFSLPLKAVSFNNSLIRRHGILKLANIETLQLVLYFLSVKFNG